MRPSTVTQMAPRCKRHWLRRCAYSAPTPGPLDCITVQSGVRPSIRYGALLASLLVIALIVPLFQETRAGSLAMDIVGTAILASGVWAAARSRRDLVILVALAILMTARWLPFVNERAGIIFSSVAAFLFFAHVAAIILIDLTAATEVSVDTIGGALCGYAMIGIAWGALYFLIDLLNPDAFNLSRGESTYVMLQTHFFRLVYYSFATLTTVGYGDITARSVLTQNLSAIEAIVGQFYIAVLVAGLVSLHLMQRQAK